MNRPSTTVAPPPAAPQSVAGVNRTLLIAGFLILLTFSAYWGVGRCGFVNLDDDAYVEYQPMVNQGFRPAAVEWALTAVHSSNWHPLTTLSHILDCELFGVNPVPMHWENFAWHTLNTLLVFFVWRAFSGTLWRSAFVAALFALHPLHVESVAWISERKDVLSTSFWLLGLLAYRDYARRPSLARYALVALAMILALLSKPMAVTFPCTLLLLDFWPLHRWPGKKLTFLFTEKLPLFGLVAAHSIVTYVVQHGSGAADFGTRFSFGVRLGNAAVSYVRYLGKTFWPSSLSPFYAHPGVWPWWAVVAALAILAATSFIVVRAWRTRGWLAFGWFWFLGTLVPVIGLVQVGAQSMAERYTYIPLLGIFTIIAWEGAELALRQPKWRTPLIAAMTSALALCWFLTQRQVSAWENSVQLYTRTISSGHDNATLRYLLAIAQQATGRPEVEAVANFHRALELEPDYTNATTQLAIIAMRQQRTDEAIALLQTTVRAQPTNPGPYLSLAAVYANEKRYDEAMNLLREALHLNPRFPDTHRELSRLYITLGRREEALVEVTEYVRLSPWNAEAVAEKGAAEANLRHYEQSRQDLKRAIWLNPKLQIAHDNLHLVEQLIGGKN